MVLENQLNRKELINHCKNLADGVTNEPDHSLLRDGYEYVYGKLDQKHDLFKKIYQPTTRLAALMCALSRSISLIMRTVQMIKMRSALL